MAKRANILLVTKGHPFEKGPFLDWIDRLDIGEVTHIEHPAAEAFIGAGLADTYDLWMMYDMPGYIFGPPDGVVFVDPSEAFKSAFSARLEMAGKPVLFLHHALAGWPTWPEYGAMIGGRFLYRPGRVNGVVCADSGYKHGVNYTASLEPHTITDGLAPAFEVTDELYLAQIFEAEVTPLARSDYTFDSEHFFSASQAVDGQMYSNDGWSHPAGSNLVAWINSYGRANTAYLQMGDSPAAYSNEAVTALLKRMAKWLLEKTP